MKTKTLLIVEDDPNVLANLQDIMSELVGRVVVSPALATIPDDCKPDAILLDLNLPNGFGLRTVAHVRSLYPKPPIIILTGYTDYTLEEMMRAGADDLIFKASQGAEELKNIIVKSILRRETIQKEVETAWEITDQTAAEVKGAIQDAKSPGSSGAHKLGLTPKG